MATMENVYVRKEEVCSRSEIMTQLTIYIYIDYYWINVLSVYLAYFIFLSSGTGSFELRGDGSIHEWTIENQTPAGSAKLNKAALDLAVFGVRVKTGASNTAVLMRTHPPNGYPGNYLNYVTTNTSQRYPFSSLSFLLRRATCLRFKMGI